MVCHSRNAVLRVAILVGVLLMPRCARSDNELDTSVVVQGVLARAQAVFSGRFEYHQRSGFAGQPDSVHEGDYHFSFQATSWALERTTRSRIHGSDESLVTRGTRLNHRDKFVDYVQHPQRDGTYDHTAHIYDTRPLDKGFPYPPYFAGTFWFRTTPEFITEHAGDARLARTSILNGVETQVLEWDVPAAEKYQAFFAINNSLDRGGVLRVYVAPELGFALPRVEDVAPDGRVACRYDARDFQEAAPGVFLPGNVRRQMFRPDGTAGHFVEYEIDGFEKINEPIPESDFILVLPPETKVADTRTPGGATIFEAGNPVPTVPEDVSDVIRSTDDVLASRGWWRAVLVGVSLGLLGLLGLFLLVRWRKNSRAAGGA